MNKDKLKDLISNFNYIRSIPLWIIYLISSNKELITSDIEENIKRRDGNRHNDWCRLRQFNYLMTCYPEFRNVFYKRLGIKSYLVSWMFPRMKPLYISTEKIGSGLVLFHGFSSILYAKSIGENCTFYHNVTLGKKKDIPTIGNNVTVCAGAMVIGGVNIGDNVTIGANALVNKDVPSNSTVVGNPMRIISK